ncbi:MAG: hypothetical protein V1647_01690, partial [Pseudomonadota bacterium]
LCDLSNFLGEDAGLYIKALEEIVKGNPSQMEGAYMLAAAVTALALEDVSGAKTLSLSGGFRGLDITIKLDKINSEFALNKDKLGYDPETARREGWRRGKEAFDKKRDMK